MKTRISQPLLCAVFVALTLGVQAQTTIDETTQQPYGIQCNANLMPTGQGQHQWGSSYTNWNSLSTGKRAAQTIVWLQVAPASFHTNNFALADASGGYIGLQTQHIGANGDLTTNVRFSIWNAVASRGGQCRTFGGEGVGHTCELLPFPLTLGTHYTLSVERMNTEPDGTWWQGAVFNEQTQQNQIIGQIKVKHLGLDRTIRNVSNFSEYFGPRAADCNSVPQSKVSWTAPTTTNDAGATTADQFLEFLTATPAQSCSEAGVQASGELITVGQQTFHRMTNGSIPMCQSVPINCPLTLVYSNQTLAGNLTQDALHIALGPNLSITGSNTVLRSPKVVFRNGTAVRGDLVVSNTPNCT